MMMKIYMYIYILGQCHDFDPKALVQYRHSKKKHGKNLLNTKKAFHKNYVRHVSVFWMYFLFSQ